MHITAIANLQEAPTMSSLLGARGHEEVVSRINQTWEKHNRSGFNFDDIPLHRDCGKLFRAAQLRIEEDLETLQELNVADKKEVYQAITNANQLFHLTEGDKLVIATAPAVRPLAIAGVLDLYGWTLTSLPENDPFESVLEVGLKSDNEGVPDEYVSRCIDTSTLDLTDRDIENIEKTRDFIDEFMAKQLGHPRQKDPTAYPECIGKIQ